MLHTYRKTALIEAEQFNGSDEMVKKYSVVDMTNVTSVPLHGPRWFLPTKEGTMELYENDWIATGIDGEHWVIANDIFHKTYERCD
ncbi:hypothetical protein [Limosilactobacillus reuteri]|uniref:hypothetical protein n=1 Tax=Limosilactobacillus reuteri TaxID=1598 RepID=UPI00081BD9FB|nr:hypothetical protein [Limosilactobacillus reuteri]OCW61425.1 hypothetical protein BBP10_10160 [Limosilactobacillus reuteri]OCW66969.1 hypothetical protein BBP12_10485 [Limosilactobacillus reuteri]OCW67458.1 hypothetical protein BBP11_10605 [Limosilactobacillus reuteri]OCW71313.1 hypothetical protein BBP13_11920 [Limosilactobacillus reuteri]